MFCLSKWPWFLEARFGPRLMELSEIELTFAHKHFSVYLLFFQFLGFEELFRAPPWISVTSGCLGWVFEVRRGIMGQCCRHGDVVLWGSGTVEVREVGVVLSAWCCGQQREGNRAVGEGRSMVTYSETMAEENKLRYRSGPQRKGGKAETVGRCAEVQRGGCSTERRCLS